MRSNIFILIMALFFCINTNGQNTFPSTGAAGIGTTTPDASSLLEMKSTSKGLLISRMTQAQRNAIVAPATGLLIYQTNGTPGFYYYNGTAWTAISTKGANTSLSNLKSPTAVNVDLLPASDTSGSLGSSSLRWKDINLYDLKFSDGTVQSTAGVTSQWVKCFGIQNTAVGIQSLTSVTSGAFNTACGFQSLYSNTSGSWNSGIGQWSLYSNTTGEFNSALGMDALYLNTTGNYNSATGYSASYSNTTGNDNTSNGFNALWSNTTGSDNTATGFSSMYRNSSGVNNTAYGSSALHDNGAGNNNTALGSFALYHNTTGGFNTAIGNNALNVNTTGGWNTANGHVSLYSNTVGIYNTATGDYSLNANTNGNYNTANGASALVSNTSGATNTADGYQAARFNSSGNDNTALGSYAMYSNSTGSQNTALGNNAYFISNNLSNTTCVGYNSGGINNYSDIIEVGNTSVWWIGGQVGWSTYSDGRVKDNVRDDVPGLAFINKLRPVSYNYNIHKENEMIHKGKKDEGDWKEKYDIEKKRFTGFVAQDVEKAANDLKYDFSGLVKPADENGLYSLRYGDFVMPLVKAVQELSKQNDSLQQNNQMLNDKLNSLSEKIDRIENALSQCSCLSSIVQPGVNNSEASAKIFDQPGLEQNVPNPFNQSAYIKYHIPLAVKNATIIVSDAAGRKIIQFNNLQHGTGTVTIEAGALTSGAYLYTLVADGRNVATKQMILTK